MVYDSATRLSSQGGYMPLGSVWRLFLPFWGECSASLLPWVYSDPDWYR